MTLEDKIKHLRSQMLIHSCLYYEMDDSVIDDHTWQHRADLLTELQKELTELKGSCKIGFYDDSFSDWDGSTGCHLPLQDAWVVRKAYQIRDLCNARK